MSKSLELRKLSVEDLKAKLNTYNEDLFKLRIQIATGSVKNKHSFIEKRKELARVQTILNEKLGELKK
jgi:large subunit ribosomal protein L29